MWKYNQNLKCFLKDNRNVDVCEYWVYHSVMDKKRCQKGAVFPYINKNAIDGIHAVYKAACDYTRLYLGRKGCHR